jgi:hypothetical protein
LAVLLPNLAKLVTFISLAALPMRSNTNSVHKHPLGNHTHSPSVPLSVYRELAAELQAAQAMLDTLTVKNQQLAKQNQQLRQEIEKVAQHILHLQQVADVTVVNKIDVYHPNRDLKSKPSRAVKSTRSTRQVSQPQVVVPSSFPVGTAGSGCSENVFIEVDSYRRRHHSARASEVSGWKLAIAILLVTATAFSAGYLLVRPLLSSR